MSGTKILLNTFGWLGKFTHILFCEKLYKRVGDAEQLSAKMLALVERPEYKPVFDRIAQIIDEEVQV